MYLKLILLIMFVFNLTVSSPTFAGVVNSGLVSLLFEHYKPGSVDLHESKTDDITALDLEVISGDNRVSRQTNCDNQVLDRLINIQSAKVSKDLSFQTFINEFVYNTLERNTWSFPISDIEQLKDPKINTIPKILVLKGISRDKATSLNEVEVKDLPPLQKDSNGIKRIVSKLEPNSLIWLPYPFIVGGSFHKEMYPHDTSAVVWSLLELLRTEKLESPNKMIKLVEDQLRNFYFQTFNFGFPLNGNRGYYITRSQTNIIPTNAIQHYEITKDKDFLKTCGLPTSESVFNDWTCKLAQIETPSGVGYRWIEHGEGPCQEVIESHGEHNYYYFKVLETLVNFLNSSDDERPDYAKGFDYKRVVDKINTADIERFKTNGLLTQENNISTLSMGIKPYLLDKTVSKYAVSEPVIKVNNSYYKLSREYYKNDRASRVSGYDTNHLYGPFNSFTYDFIPADHVILLYKQARDISHMHKILGNALKEGEYSKKAKKLKGLVINLLWDEQHGMFFDYNSKDKKLRTSYPFLSSAYGIFTGIFDIKDKNEKRKLVRLVNFLEVNLEGPTGFYASTIETSLHWDKPFVWPVQQQYIVGGLREYARELKKQGDLNLSNYFEKVADRILIKYLLANYSDWLSNNGTKIGEKVIPQEKELLTGYEAGNNYTWNLTAVLYLYNSLSTEGRKAFDSLIN